MERITCGHCGWDNREGVTTCTNCGRPLGVVPVVPPVPPAPQTPTTMAAPKNVNPAVLPIILGAVGFFMCGPVTAIPGLILARKHLKDIQQGLAPKANESLARIGFWLCVGSTVLYLFFLLIWIGAALLGPILGMLNSR